MSVEYHVYFVKYDQWPQYLVLISTDLGTDPGTEQVDRAASTGGDNNVNAWSGCISRFRMSQKRKYKVSRPN